MKYEIFDLDSTLFMTPGPAIAGLLPDGIPEYMLPLHENGYKWWENEISLDPKLTIPALTASRQAAIDAMKDPDTYSILITHRHPHLKNTIVQLLKKYNLGFNKVIITTSNTKKPDVLLDKLPDIINAESIILYEDSIVQYLDYRDFFDKHNIPYTFKLMTARSMVTIDNIEISDVVRNEVYFNK